MEVYKVTLQLTTYVLAESEADAMNQITSNSCQWVENTILAREADLLTVSEVTELGQVEKDWQNCFPHTRHRKAAYVRIKDIVGSRDTRQA